MKQGEFDTVKTIKFSLWKTIQKTDIPINKPIGTKFLPVRERHHFIVQFFKNLRYLH